MKDEFIMVHTSCESKEEATRLSQGIVTEKLGACVQLYSNVESVYTWNDHIMNEKEYILNIKTKAILFNRLETFIIENHSYQVPEIIATPLVMVSEAYGDWIRKNTA